MADLSRRTTLALMSASALAPLGACASGAAEPAAPAPAGADAAFEAIAARAIDGMARHSPIGATELGDHRFDAEIDDLSPAGRRAGADFRKSILAELDALDSAGLSAASKVDRSMLAQRFKLALWHDETAETWAWDPLPYNDRAGGALYALMARDFAPLPERLNNAAARMEKLPGLFAQARENLVAARVPKVHAETLSRQNKGLASIVNGMILPQAEALGPADRARLASAAETLLAAVEQHQAWIDATLVPNAAGDFRLGADLYDQKLALALHSPMSRADIRAAAETRMAEIRAEMADLAGEIVTPPANERWTMQRHIAQALERAAADRPARANLETAARHTLDETTAFLRRADIITLPDAPVNIIQMPEFQRGVAVAYCDSPGPLDRGQSTFYAVSPIPEDWTDAQAASFLREYNNRSLQELTIHEAMPGHYVQLWHSNKYPSVTRAAFYSGAFVEGWACYAQDVMLEAGYQDNHPLAALVNRKWALRVISNALLDQAVHVDGMSREDAMRLMTEDAFQEEREAAGKWIRAQVSSAQLPTYFVGWTEHHAVRREAEQRWGDDFTLKRYHDSVLSFGSPPVRHARALLFGEPIEA